MSDGLLFAILVIGFTVAMVAVGCASWDAGYRQAIADAEHTVVQAATQIVEGA